MKKQLISILVLTFGAFVQAETLPKSTPSHFVEHQVGPAETAWFLAQVYYGTGLKFTEILKANQLQSADEIKAGMRVKVLNPRFQQSQPNFKSRYQRLADQRDEKLKMQKTEIPKRGDVGSLPVGSLQKKNKLPFARIQSHGKSAADLAKEELGKSLRTSENKD